MIEIQNETLRVRISETGGKLESIYGRNTHTEYLWQGDKAYWGGKAPNLFPFIGRLYDKRYQLDGKSYNMKIHGFLSGMEMAARKTGESSCVFTAEDTEQTRAVYPYRFRYEIGYELLGNELQITFCAQNRSEKTMYCGMGGHPGFNVPLEKNLKFEDYVLSFEDSCRPNLVNFSEGVLCTGIRTPYPLQEGKLLPLSHSLFTQDAIVLADTPGAVTLGSPKGDRGVTVTYPQMPYVGFWHKPNSDAPFLCIEPWSMLPGREGIVENLPDMPDITSIPPGGTAENRWSIHVF